ncbi:hypothetical protein BU26DRAFT_565437 [Trematosphaeria pertusa]|uniref:Uncharacterized protein n=1 Tax=Trematosphaeria pertusa TaxID=390896 RepID=A0A6A6ID76_9PLEO|nr:uncharacterized protein BU26DRAFT_565437 [Trematosphaeria pertusa]KAF2248018.1 hypothetical protein BU26DRAFT_565437 [Trematosphaeria pertusa]
MAHRPSNLATPTATDPTSTLKYDPPNMDDLTQEQQDLIRSKVVRSSPLDASFLAKEKLNSILMVLPEPLRNNAWEMHLRENMFHFADEYQLHSLVFRNPKDASLLCKISVDFDCPLDAMDTMLADDLAQCTGLEALEIGADEALLVCEASRRDKGYQEVRMRPQDIGFALNLLVLRLRGIRKLRQLHIPKVTFTPRTHGGHDNSYRRRTTGPIPGGVLETVVARDMMRSNIVTSHQLKPRKGHAAGKAKVKTSQSGPAGKRGQTDADVRNFLDSSTKADSSPLQPSHFRFLDLPAELRNRVYQLLLGCHGAVSPSDRVPLSADLKDSKSPIGEAPHSALALLETNKQIYEEAVGIYYATASFVFYYPLQSMIFLEILSDKRKSYLSSITLWYKNQRQGRFDVVDMAILQLLKLRNLKKLEIILDERTAHLFGTSRTFRMPGEQWLRELSKNGVAVAFRCQEADTILWHNDPSEYVPGVFMDKYRQRDVNKAREMQKGCQLAEDRITEN